MLSEITSIIFTVLAIIAGVLALLSEELNTNRKLKYTVVAVLFALALYAAIGGLIALQPTETENADTARTDIPIAIDATKDWQRVGISVHTGQSVSINVVGGSWTAAREKVPLEAISGLPDRYRIGREVWSYSIYDNPGNGGNIFCENWGLFDCPVPTAKIGTLIAKIGTSEPFTVGPQKIFVATSSGPLFFRINDGEREGVAHLQDNAGVLAVEILIIK